MKAIATKGALSLLGISGLGTGIYYGYKALTSKEKVSDTNSVEDTPKVPETATVQETITEEGRTVLKASEEGWDIKFHAYTSLTSKVEITPNTEEGLKTWCTNVLSKPLNNKDNTYLQAKQVCTLPTSKEKLLKEAKTLATEGDWQGRADEYTRDGRDSLAIPEFKDKGTPISQEDIKNWCTTALESEITKEKSNYNLTLKWCTKTGE